MLLLLSLLTLFSIRMPGSLIPGPVRREHRSEHKQSECRVVPGDPASHALPVVSDESKWKGYHFHQQRTRPCFSPSVITAVHWQQHTTVISLKVYVRAGFCTDTRNNIPQLKVTALCLTCSRQLGGWGKLNLTGANERHLTFPRVMHSEVSQVEKLHFIIYNKRKNTQPQKQHVIIFCRAEIKFRLIRTVI